MSKYSLLVLLILCFSVIVYADEQAEHPVAMEGNDCSYCHAPESKSENKSESPAYSSWQKSLHFVNNVRCVTCHGDESNFRPQSSINDCKACHVDVVENNLMSKATCATCHPAHEFFVHKSVK